MSSTGRTAEDGPFALVSGAVGGPERGRSIHLGLDLGGTNVKCAVLDGGEVVATASCATGAGGAGVTSIVPLTPESLSWSCTCCDGVRTARSGTDIR